MRTALLSLAMLGLTAPDVAAQPAGRGAGSEPPREAAIAAATVAERQAGETALVVWPNPSAAGASVSLMLVAASDVRVAVYDLLGRVVATPLAGTLAAGEHRAAVEAGVLAPGVYVVRAEVRTGSAASVKTVRLTVLR